MTDLLTCPKCGNLVNSESVRGQRKRYFCMANCGWGSYKKPSSNVTEKKKEEKQLG